MTTSTSTQATRIALVTGASRGLGRSAALHLARAGWDLVITYRSRADEAETVVRQLHELGRRACALQLDTGRIESFPVFVRQVQDALHRFGASHLDALVNNAGYGIDKSFLDTTEADFDDMANVHVKGVFFLTQALVPLLGEDAHILNVSSGLTRFTYPGKAVYAIMKGSVEVLTRYLAQELGPKGIRVNCLAPGAIATDFGGGIVRDNPQVAQQIASVTALGRPGQPDDVGAACAMLLSGGSGWITGQRIEVSGGMRL